ncbi:MAG: DUF4139 domain-containing protein [Comamonadaceae bacterium]|nr:DUF4139 domain-containing protein [Comamonadaceae bacterium]
MLPFIRVCTLSVLAGALWPAAGMADALPEGASRITHVTVYPGVATVERTARVAAGARRFVFDCLPAALDVSSLHVSGDAAVRVGELSVQTVSRDLAPACASPLEARIRTLEDDLAAVQAELDAVQLATGYLQSVARSSPAPAAAASASRVAALPGAAQIGATADVLRQSGQAAFLRAHQLQRRKEALARELKPLTAERDRVAAEGSRVSAVAVTLAAERAGTLRLAYRVRGPGWQPSYRAVLDVASARVRLERQALVAQATGEDWRDVALTLSTGQPGRATQGALPRPWTLAIAPPPSAAPMAELQAPMAPAAPAALSTRSPARAARQSESDAPPLFDVSTFDKSYVTEFSVPQRITVPASGERVTLSLGSADVPATIITRTAPQVEAAAYLVAELQPPPGIWPAGPVSLTRDGAFVGTGRLDFSQPAPLGLAFGRDEKVQVQVEPAQDMRGSAGFIANRAERQTRRAWRVENRHGAAIDLQVLDAAPVSRDERISVQSRYEPEPASTAFNRQPGLIEWRQPLAAGASARFSAEHTVRYPQDARLQERQP